MEMILILNLKRDLNLFLNNYRLIKSYASNNRKLLYIDNI